MLFRGPSPDSDVVKLPMGRGMPNQSEAAKAGLASGELTFDLVPVTLMTGVFDVCASRKSLPGLRGGMLGMVDRSYVFSLSSIIRTECEDFQVSLLVLLAIAMGTS